MDITASSIGKLTSISYCLANHRVARAGESLCGISLKTIVSELAGFFINQLHRATRYTCHPDRRTVLASPAMFPFETRNGLMTCNCSRASCRNGGAGETEDASLHAGFSLKSHCHKLFQQCFLSYGNLFSEISLLILSN